MKIEHDEVCHSCSGTGLYVGLAERDGAAVVCHKCDGTGCFHFVHEYTPFKERIGRSDVKRVFETNPGICIGTGKDGRFNLSDFGGMPFSEWESGKVFPSRSENRGFTCPAWWYQSADYKKKPGWDECISCGSFSGCKSFPTKAECWKRFDKDNREPKQ